MSDVRRAAVVVVVLAGCLGRGAPATRPGDVDARITLYRGAALIEEHLRIPIDADGHGAIGFAPTLVTDGSLEVVGETAPVLSWSHAHGGVGDEVVVHLGGGARPGRRLAVGADGSAAVAIGDDIVITGRAQLAEPAAQLVVTTRPGVAALQVRVRYRTTGLTWRASYTLIDDGDQRGRLVGALALDNRTGRQWQRAALTLTDRELPEAPAGAPGPERRLLRLGAISAIAAGAQRIDLGLPTRRLALAPVLMFDPVGDKLDGGGMRPNEDPAFGVGPWPTDVAESLAPDLARVTDAPLPAGPLRMFRLTADGQLAWLGEGQVLPPADDAQRTPAIAIGRADAVTGHRERTMIDVDYEAERLVEEFVLRFDNRGDRPVRLVAREHMYRGKCWSLVYFSTTEVAKAGEQQVLLGVTVPARGRATIGYRVAYKWSASACKP